MATELIPIVDLLVLSQSELVTLALSSPNAFDLRRCDDVVVPKIDRSVFNESAGSLKQTYSRLRLAPPKTDSLSPSIPRRRGRPRSIPLRTTAAASATNSSAPSDQPQNDPDHRENLLVASFIRRLFSREDPSSQTLPPDKAVSSVFANETNEGWRNIIAAAGDGGTVLRGDEEENAWTDDGGAASGIFFRVGGAVWEQEEDEDVCGCFCVWRRASERWKPLLGLKRKEGAAWLDCRRYVSPKGYQFVSCKEVSSYIFSLQGSMQPVSDTEDDNTHSSDKVTNGSVKSIKVSSLIEALASLQLHLSHIFLETMRSKQKELLAIMLHQFPIFLVKMRSSRCFPPTRGVPRDVGMVK